MPTVSALHIYPVKSCRGHSLPRADIDNYGLVGDRRFLIVDESGRLVTQREIPAIALIEATATHSHITLDAPRMERIELAVNSSADSIDVTVWRDSMRATNLGPAVAGWLSRYLQYPVRLVTLAPDFQRAVNAAVAQPGDELAFADAHPLLIISEASLDDLNQRLDFPLPMNRFRPNIVIGGSTACEEDRWRRIRIGRIVLRASGPCGRCVITTTDQDTLERSREPLTTLATYRRDARGEVNFGQNYIHETKSGAISVGDAVEILE